jgi:FxLD family lantipeptide
MTVQSDQVAARPTTPTTDSEFDLDVRIVESGPVIAELLRLTDDNCGQTCESACNSCA